MSPIELSLFVSRLESVCDEMAAILRRAALSPNIRDRLDFSCALFDANGELVAQAAHIPVHLGSMAWAMRDLVARFDWQDGDAVVVNDPYLGGTHLPDVTFIMPVVVNDAVCGFVANRAHHADIGASEPGSMPIASSLEEEGLVISPLKIVAGGERDQAAWEELLAALGNPAQSEGDFQAQISANLLGCERVAALVESPAAFALALSALNDYGRRLALDSLSALPAGEWRFEDVMDDDGQGNRDIPIRATLTIRHRDGTPDIAVDFSGTAEQVSGNINCPLPVTVAAVWYCFRCLMPEQVSACAGAFSMLAVSAPVGSLVNAVAPAAVAAGNVETSTRLVDVVLGLLAQVVPEKIPAASHGSMNNLAMGGESPVRWNYYETIGGGMGAGPASDGVSGIQTHMTNTLNTPVEVLEQHYPLLVTNYAYASGTGGHGRHCGGRGLQRGFRFLADARFTLLTERRRSAPWALDGGQSGTVGRNIFNGDELPPKTAVSVRAGDELLIQTPGGGGYGPPV